MIGPDAPSPGTPAIESETLYDRIYALVRQIPPGRVATYGQIAAMVGRCSARTVGFAMAAVPSGSNIPWHRVINQQGTISERRHGDGGIRQRRLLEQEGVYFDRADRVDFGIVGWRGID
jgi:methylated-DNA-protein-cysteine methyltransferase-like protein